MKNLANITKVITNIQSIRDTNKCSWEDAVMSANIELPSDDALQLRLALIRLSLNSTDAFSGENVIPRLLTQGITNIKLIEQSDLRCFFLLWKEGRQKFLDKPENIVNLNDFCPLTLEQVSDISDKVLVSDGHLYESTAWNRYSMGLQNDRKPQISPKTRHPIEWILPPAESERLYQEELKGQAKHAAKNNPDTQVAESSQKNRAENTHSRDLISELFESFTPLVSILGVGRSQDEYARKINEISKPSSRRVIYEYLACAITNANNEPIKEHLKDMRDILILVDSDYILKFRSEMGSRLFSNLTSKYHKSCSLNARTFECRNNNSNCTVS